LETRLGIRGPSGAISSLGPINHAPTTSAISIAHAPTSQFIPHAPNHGLVHSWLAIPITGLHVTRWPTGLRWEIPCQAVAQKAGNSVILAQGLSRRRLKRSDSMTMQNAVADAKEEISHREKREEVVDERAWMDAIK
jgi:hypothetical protein